jgi:hypothetical protein
LGTGRLLSCKEWHGWTHGMAGAADLSLGKR